MLGWWETPHSICSLNWRDFLPKGDFCGMRDFRETWWEETLVLARALQHFVERLGIPSGVLCDAAQDLQRCMAPFMCLKGDDILEASLLGANDNEPGTSLSLANRQHFWVMIPYHREPRQLPHALLMTTRRPQSLKEQLSWGGLQQTPGHAKAATAAATRIQTASV